MHCQVHGHVHVGHVHVNQHLSTYVLSHLLQMGLKPKTLYTERSTTELPRQLSWLAPNLISHSKPDEQANNHTIQCSEVCTLILCKCYMQLLFLLLQPTESELACSVFVDGEKINIKTNF